MKEINRQGRKIAFRDSRRLILHDKLGFFLKIGIFLIGLFATNIIAVFIGKKISVILGILCSILIGVLVNGLFNKFLLISEKEGYSINIHSSNITFITYLNLLIWKFINKIIVVFPILISVLNIINTSLFIKGDRIYIEKIPYSFVICLIASLIIGLLIDLLFLPVEYILVEESEKNLIKALIKSFNISKRKIGSTLIVLIVLNLQVYIIGVVAFFGYRTSGFGILTLLAFLFVVVALAGYARLVKIKWYRTLVRLGKK
ncbi:MAG: hypothetical protein ACRDDY_16985 [Clostridium sp.]|uniref:hypothetical protein n=1 Tax=Clostridium sp. TaxID=1506 RepID=UPI003EE611BA